MSATPGWYRDPSVPGQLRYFDGSAWTDHVQADPTGLTIQQVAPSPVAPPQATSNHQAPYQHGSSYPQQVPQAQPYYQPLQQVQVNQISVAPRQEKSVAVALVLTFFFGPLGMLYSTVVGAIVMFFANLILGTLTFGLFLLISWPIQMIWAGVAASETRKAAIPTVNVQGAAPMAAPMTAPQNQAGYQQNAQWVEPAPRALPQSTGPTSFTTPAETEQMPQQGSSTWYS